jgi:hypothetical protein
VNKVKRVRYNARKEMGFENGDLNEFNNGVKKPLTPDEMLATTSKDIMIKKSDGIVLINWPYGGSIECVRVEIKEVMMEIKLPESNKIKTPLKEVPLS